MGELNITLTLKRKLIAASIVVLLVVISGLYQLIFSPKMADTRQLRMQTHSVNNQIKNMIKAIKFYRARQNSMVKEQLYFQEKFLTGTDQIPQILSVLGDVVRKSKVDVIAVRPLKLEKENINGFQFRSLKIVLRLNGKYFALIDCLKRFLEIPFLVNITDLQIDKEKKGILNMQLNLKTYFLYDS
ncbi:type 4a pilus biogenesis protein PilO [Candidatus Margulisiibacteriota bacterium]